MAWTAKESLIAALLPPPFNVRVCPLVERVQGQGGPCWRTPRHATWPNPEQHYSFRSPSYGSQIFGAGLDKAPSILFGLTSPNLKPCKEFSIHVKPNIGGFSSVSVLTSLTSISRSHFGQ